MTKNKKKKNGKIYWQSLKELTGHANIQETIQSQEIEKSKGVSRREFLGLMGASLALAGLASCRRPVEKIIPYVIAPEEIIPGIPNFYATSMQRGLDAIGLVIENHEGRPTKIEGNKKHPSSLGKTDSFTQAEILNLYDPDRAKKITHNGSQSNLDEFLTAWSEIYDRYTETGGDGLAVISELNNSPTFVHLKKDFHRLFPNAKWVNHEPISSSNILNGIKLASADNLLPIYHLEKANVILALDSDFLMLESDSIRNSIGFADKRRVNTELDDMNRLYVAESSLSVTGAMADHRAIVRSSDMGVFALAIATELNNHGVAVASIPPVETKQNFDKKFIKEVVVDLIKHRGKSLITVGRSQPAAIHVLSHSINSALGNIGKTVTFHSINPDLFSNTISLNELTKNPPSALIMIGTNPVYSAPQHIDFESILNKADTSIQLSYHFDETAQHVNWHINQTHFLEEWNDTQAADGTLALTQPQIQPLFNGISNIEFLELLNSKNIVNGYDLVQNTWKNILKNNFIKAWEKVLHDGVHISTSSSSNLINININNSNIAAELNKMSTVTNDDIELVLKPSAATFDGSFANNGWMQELPNPISKLTWDNAALMSYGTAVKLGVKNQDVVKISNGNNYILLPVWILPGQADNSITVELGYGRTKVGRVGNNVGQNAYKLINANGNLNLTNIHVEKIGATYPLACTQDSHGMNNDNLANDAIQKRLPILIRETTLEDYKHHPEFAKHGVHHPPLVSLWEEHEYTESPQWGMTIDLNVCTGCNACTTACQSENNIPVVGKQEVRMGREMHWIRLDRYFTGEPDNPDVAVQPVACQHCEMAPCEQVCPVAATTHSEDGLNGMTYNRCVGTRYCANNCPYKVRRFNFFNYTKDIPEIVQMAHNPDVSVRFRGVMEKCSYCVQRVNSAKIKAKNESRDINDSEIVSACQQVCPTNAITFGNILDPKSKVSKARKNNRNYALLGEMNLKPRTLYQAKLRNPNPKLDKQTSKTNHG